MFLDKFVKMMDISSYPENLVPWTSGKLSKYFTLGNQLQPTFVPDSLQAIFPTQEAKAMLFSRGCNSVHIYKSNKHTYWITQHSAHLLDPGKHCQSLFGFMYFFVRGKKNKKNGWLNLWRKVIQDKNRENIIFVLLIH